MKSVAIVLSAGVGRRMGADIPKQYLMLGDYPVIYYCLNAFEQSPVDEVILVCAESDIDYCRMQIIDKYQFQKVKAIVSGGAERYDSVYRGLQEVSEDTDYVLIHDGARPMLTVDLIRRLLTQVEKEKACVPAVPATDTIKVSDEQGYAVDTPDRKTLWMVQTPQVFSCDIVKNAYEQIYQKPSPIPITDDAMVVETYTNNRVKLVMGDYSNRKITTPEDLAIANYLLKIQ
ncbi:MAG: 2-C-methyl-D-erythritol 4-phosphate cytidylyltransferase [Agathobacter sp.]|uniref:2-C-methyl-D-erythritol 4-phosphate cytidylyltransferase n=1 Tax=Agathobacter sp. TaxID=2021311 RepID=UPI00257B802D|nr:2-C-methyl-D-erythritol 4-phosphate cytidylyltransferase [Agathobacter sp.]MBQ1682632.1 2-C-methyl-D-erythritol 4-phosphate cytidylyltransferase [Agathobacter sp.]